MSKDDINSFGKILLAVIVILCFLWWRSDRGRVKYIGELQAQIETCEARIEELEQENQSLREELP